jgi:hypothetical protein
MFCGAAGEALNPAERPFNNLSALRASNWTSQFENGADFTFETVLSTDGRANGLPFLFICPPAHCARAPLKMG